MWTHAAAVASGFIQLLVFTFPSGTPPQCCWRHRGGGGGVGVLTSQMFPGRWELMCCLVRVVGFDADVNMPQKLRTEKHLFNELTFPGSFPKIV